ncbi:MAG: glycoside hydrolase family 3 N-terminal domain-containing protein [Candidatus Acidiferrales bacterium]
MRRTLALAVTGILMLTVAGAAVPVPPYKSSKLTIEERVNDLLKRMTLEEKVDQLCGGHHYGILDSTGQYQPEEAATVFRSLYNVNSKISLHDVAVLRNAAQRFEMEKSRLGIPVMFLGEGLHGFMENGSTSFPQALGLASSWDPELVHQVFTAVGDEMSAAGVNEALSPVLDLARDPRWGRTEETYGEDPYLVARMGVAAIEGFQGTNDLIDRHHVAATAKHFVHGQMEGGRNTGPSNISERELRESFLVPFQAAVQEAKSGSVMVSYNEIDGIPNHINHWLLDTVLRKEWGFNGYVMSDGNGLQMLYETHHVAADKDEAARLALAAGVDYDLSDGSVYRTLVAQVKAGKVPLAEVDLATKRILTLKFRLGLFENPYVDVDYALKTTESAEHQKLAERAAEEAIVLLKNDGNLLPLNTAKYKTIAVIGPNAADVHLGGYSREPGHKISVLDGIRARVGSDAKVIYAEGGKITDGKPGWEGWYQNDVKLADPQQQREDVHAAVEVAKKADLVILVVGENETTNREAWAENHLGDRDSLDLLGAQDELIKEVLATGKPTVVFLLNGRPLSINYAAKNVPAILEGWYLGQEGGTAAARVLLGDVNPGGKIPVTFPRSVGQLPAYYDHKPSRNRSYAFVDNSPLFPFGYGLSYTTFKFDNLRLEPASIGPNGKTVMHVDVANIGDREGTEVVEMYIHQKQATVTQPVMALRGFKRVNLKPGEKVTVDLALTHDSLAMLGTDRKPVVEPGAFEVMVGPSSIETQTAMLTVEKPSLGATGKKATTSAQPTMPAGKP